MKALRYYLMTLWLASTLTAIAQKEADPVEGTQRFYQYAAALGEKNGRQALYLSDFNYVDFYAMGPPIPDSVVRLEMERQYIERLQRDYGEEVTFTFTTFLLQPDKEAVKKSYDSVIESYKKKGYKIVRVKKFSYD